ncbi:MAG: hypothetical protein Q9172_003721 [Xanthocarpia lactea]
MSTSNAVQKQWDIGVTSIASADRLIELIRGASEDNVQPQAVLAICALGSAIHPHQRLIGEGVNALGGTKNVRIENMKLSIGLQFGGTALYLRQSTPGVAAFLLVCALKLWHVDDDVGDILYEMALASGVISRWPASAQQFSQVVSTIAGNAGTILPARHLHDIGISMLGSAIQTSVRKVLYEQIAKQSVAKILTYVFSGFQDSDVHSMTLSGAASAVWLVAILTWIVPDEVRVYSGPRLIIGPQGAKLTVNLKLVDGLEQGWEFTEWRGEVSLVDLIVAQRDLGMRPHIPRLVTKHHFQSLYALSIQDTAIMGQVAGALLCVFSERGFIYHRRGHPAQPLRNENLSRVEVSTRTGLLDVASDWFCGEYALIMKHYGWTVAELQSGQTKVYEALQGWGPTFADGGYVSERDQLTNHLCNCINDIYGHRTEGYDARTYVEFAIDLATHALVFVTRNESPSQKEPEFISPSSYSIVQERMVGKLLHGHGMLSHHFRQIILEMLLPHNEKLRGDELVIAGNGMVIYPSIIADPNCKKKAALGLTVILGTIRKGKERYTVVKELQDSLPSELVELGYLRPFDGGKFVGLVPKAVPNQAELETLSTVRGTELMVKNIIRFTDLTTTQPIDESSRIRTFDIKSTTHRTGRDFSWLRAIDNLATAKHLCNEHMMTRHGEEALAKRLADEHYFEQLRWVSPFSGHEYDEHSKQGRKLVARTCQDPLLCLYQLSLPDLFAIVTHGVSLIKGIALAESIADEYVILT